MHHLRLKAANAVEGVAVNEYELGGAFRIAPHVHEDLKLGFLMRGAYTGDGDDDLEMKGPALVYYPALTKSGAAFHDTAQHFLWINVESDWLDRMGLGDTLPARAGVIVSRRFLTLANQLNTAALGGNAYPLELESALFDLLSALADEACVARAHPRWWRDALNILHEEETPVSLAEAAGLLDIHPAHLARAFKARIGCSLGEYSRRVRLARAARELGESRRPIAAVAAERGFFDQSHFNRHFKRAFGVAPSQYRARLQ